MKLAERMERLGTESAFEVLARAQKVGPGRPRIINLGIGQPDFPTPGNIVAAAQKALADGHHGYTPANGILPLREAVAEDILKWRGVEVDPDRIVIVPGGKVTMYFAITMFGEPGAEIMYPDPGFPIYRSVIEFTGRQGGADPAIRGERLLFSAEEVLAKITPRTRLIIVNGPANPTGGIVPRDELDRLVGKGLAQHPQVVVLSDEIYARMVYDNVPHASMLVYPELADRLILLDGWSKTYAMTGWRLGYAVWPKNWSSTPPGLRSTSTPASTPRPSGPGSRRCEGRRTRSSGWWPHSTTGAGVILERLNALPGFRCVRPGGAFYAFPNITGTGYSSRQLQDQLLNEAGVALVSGHQLRRPGRRLHPLLLRQLDRQHRGGDRPHRALPRTLSRPVAAQLGRPGLATAARVLPPHP